MEVFVVAHYEMKQRERERERDPFKEGREGPILHTWEFDWKLSPFGEIESLPWMNGEYHAENKKIGGSSLQLGAPMWASVRMWMLSNQ